MKVIYRIGLAGIAVMGAIAFTAAPANANASAHATSWHVSGWHESSWHGNNWHGNSWHRKHGRVHVVQPGQSIQAAIDAAHPGDTILLKAGTYTGGVRISTNNLTIRGAGSSTVLTPPPPNTDRCAKTTVGGMPIGESGICVVNPNGGTVKGVTIKNLTVRGFDGFGVQGFGTDRLSVSHVHAIDNTEYGITEFHSTRGYFVENLVKGSTEEAGLYVGDIANARGTVVKHNISVGNALGILVRHARYVNVVENTFVGNCAGVALVNDGQAGGQGNTLVAHNVIDANNKFCPAMPPEVPELQGTGVIIFGGDHNTIRGNQIVGNSGKEDVSGGVFLAPGSHDNVIVKNVIRGNDPADIVDASGNKTNVFKHNACDTSQPAGIC